MKTKIMNTLRYLFRLIKACLCALALCLSLYATPLPALSVGEIAVQGTVEADIDKTSEEVKTPNTPKPPKPPKKVSTDLQAKTGETSTALILSATALGISALMVVVVLARDRKEEEAMTL